MPPRLIRFAVAVAAVGAGVSACRAPLPDAEMAVADSGLASFGPGRARLDFRKLGPVAFELGDWSEPSAATAAVAALAEVVAGGGRVWLVGVGDAGVPAEHARQQGMARALALRSVLIQGGAPTDRILVTGVPPEDAAGLTGREGAGPRVECAVVR